MQILYQYHFGSCPKACILSLIISISFLVLFQTIFCLLPRYILSNSSKLKACNDSLINSNFHQTKRNHTKTFSTLSYLPTCLPIFMFSLVYFIFLHFFFVSRHRTNTNTNHSLLTCGTIILLSKIDI